MPGVLLAVRSVGELPDPLTVGLENLLVVPALLVDRVADLRRSRACSRAFLGPRDRLEPVRRDRLASVVREPEAPS